VSIIETINATSKHICLVVIFQSQKVLTLWFEESNIPNQLIGICGKRWTANEIARGWYREIFLPEIIPSTTNDQDIPG
ncbi:hypothetical protein C7212DRAFT_189783, partial [Tuber magnatum]